MTEEKKTKKVEKEEVKLKSFYFPSLRRSVMAKDMEHAKELLADQVKPSKEDK